MNSAALAYHPILNWTVVKHIENFLGERGGAWINQSQLPGGDFAVGGAQQLINEYHQRYPFLPRLLVERYVRSYGSLTKNILQGVESIDALGRCFGFDLYQAEVDYLVKHE